MRFWRSIAILGWKFWASEAIMVVLGLYNFTVSAQQWGYGSPNVTVSEGGVLSAATLELGLIVFLHLARFGFFAINRTKRTVVWAVAWATVSAMLAYISLHNNQLYFQDHWSPADGDPTIELWVRCVVPMGIMFLCALVPPGRATFRTSAEIDAEYDEKIHEARRQLELAHIKAQTTLDRRAASARERAIHTQMLRLAGQIGKEYLSQYQVDDDGVMETDWLSLEADLAARGLWDSEAGRPLMTRTITPGQEESEEPPNTISDKMPSLPRPPIPALPASQADQQQEAGAKDKLQQTLDLLAAHPDLTDEELARALVLNRPASARYWRLKAQEVLTKRPSPLQPIKTAPGASGGHQANEKGGQAASRSPFLGFARRKEEGPDEDDLSLWGQ